MLPEADAQRRHRVFCTRQASASEEAAPPAPSRPTRGPVRGHGVTGPRSRAGHRGDREVVRSSSSCRRLELTAVESRIALANHDSSCCSKKPVGEGCFTAAPNITRSRLVRRRSPVLIVHQPFALHHAYRAACQAVAQTTIRRVPRASHLAERFSPSVSPT
jgi:hypothetical protein